MVDARQESTRHAKNTALIGVLVIKKRLYDFESVFWKAELIYHTGV